MLNLLKLGLLALVFLVGFNPKAHCLSANHLKQPSIEVYREGQREFQRKNFSKALSLFENFIFENHGTKDKKIRQRVLWSIDLTVKTYLRVRKDPTTTISFLNKILKTVKLTESEEEAILEWISAAKEWNKFRKISKEAKSKDDLFKLGEKYYKLGMESIDFPADDAGNAYFYIAASYLVPYVNNYDNAKNVGKALFMLGNIRFRSWNDYEYWTENYYLKEVIRRYPHSELARKAYKALELGIRTGFTGSAGESTPKSQLEMLKVFKALSEPKKLKKGLK